MKRPLEGSELVAAADRVLNVFYLFISEFEDSVAGDAVEVLVILVPEDVLVTRLLFIEHISPEKAAFDEQLQGAIDGGFGNQFPL